MPVQSSHRVLGQAVCQSLRRQSLLAHPYTLPLSSLFFFRAQYFTLLNNPCGLSRETVNACQMIIGLDSTKEEEAASNVQLAPHWSGKIGKIGWHHTGLVRQSKEQLLGLHFISCVLFTLVVFYLY